jgi:AcrR family transcriptional regulator
MNKTKEKILNAAKGLFNELGFSQVTIRMIAERLKMSSGNLNYHFRKREDILEALYFEMVRPFDERVEQLGEEKISLASMQRDIFSSMQRMLEYHFIWTDLHYILSSSPNIQSHFNKVLIERKNGYRFLFQYFQEQKILKKLDSKKEYEWLIDRMIDFSNTFLYASILYEGKTLDEAYLRYATELLMSNIYPYLTEKGKEDFKQLYPLI